MKRTLSLLSSLLLFIGASAQRSYELVQDSTFWLTAGNAAALTEMESRSISNAEVFYDYGNGGAFRSLQGHHNSIFGGDVKSYTRLSQGIVASGSVGYSNNSFSRAAGSMLLPTEELIPFDLLEADNANAGNKRFEQFNVRGAVGWNCFRNLSIGASADFTAGSYAKFKDLRHTNSLMNLEVRAGLYYALGKQSGVGAAAIYRRRTETISFETFGTSDKTYQTLIDYANGGGVMETYGSEGFTDSNHELPLFSQFTGFSVQGGYNPLFATLTYQHRTGYYGRKSQYTVCHSNNSGDLFSARLRYVLPEQKGYLCMFEAELSTQILSTFRTNYVKVNSPSNPSVTYYEYYPGTKMSDKARTESSLKFLGYWKPQGEIYLWETHADVSYLWQKQTAYLLPDMVTTTPKTINMAIRGKRNFILRDRSIVWTELELESRLKNYGYLSTGIMAGYEFSLRATDLRPYIAASCSLMHGLSDPIEEKTRKTVRICAGVTF